MAKKTFIQKFLYDCEEATTLSTQLVSGEKRSFISRIRFHLHNLICPPCLHFHEDNKKIQEIIEKGKEIEPQLNDEWKEELAKKLEHV